MSEAVEDRGDAGTGTGPRDLPPFLGRLVIALALATALAHLYFNTLGTLSDLRVSALHFGLFGLICALTIPAATVRGAAAKRAVLALDIVLGLAALGTALYLFAFEQALYDRGVRFAATDWIAASLAIVLALEFVRRTTGWLIPILTVLALSYVVVWGQWLDGVFAFPGLSLETLLYRGYFSTEGMFGSIARISWSVVFMFILFGAFLVRSGAGEFIIDLARLAAGRLAGGSGLVAVFSSGLMGSVTGSAVANAVSTGVVTIPLMKRSGLTPRSAAGIEAAASTGGQLMPPVMGAGAFIMASFTQLSYTAIIAAAAIPALLYFLSVAFYVRIQACRLDLRPEPDPDLKLGSVLRRGWPLLIPLGLLIGLLIAGFTPTYAAGIATVTVVAASWLSPTPMGVKAVIEAVLNATRTMTATAMLLIAVGLIVMVIGATGVGNTVSLMINTWAGGSLMLTIALVALASLILGMGLPVTAAYIVLAALSAPAIHGLMLDAELARSLAEGTANETVRALIMIAVPDAMTALAEPMTLGEARALLTQVPPELAGQLHTNGLDPAFVTAALLSAHMIVFWLSQDSNVTPPVCLAAFAAAGIAKTPPMGAGFAAWRIAKGLYVIPLLFAYTPLIGGSAGEIALIALFTSFGLYAATAAMEGYLEGPMSVLGRLAAITLALILLWPHGFLWLSMAGLAGFAALFWLTRKSTQTPLSAPS